MKILVIVSFRQYPGYYAYPSTRQGVFATITDDESVLDFHGLDKGRIKFNDPMYRRLDTFLFDEYNHRKWECGAYLNKCFSPAAKVISECGAPDKIVLVEAH